MPELQHLPADADASKIVASVEQDGAVILDNVISPDFIAALREETDPYMDNTSNEKTLCRLQPTRTGGLLIRSEKCRELIEHETILNPCREFLPPSAKRYSCTSLRSSAFVRAKRCSLFIAISGPGVSTSRTLSLSSTPFGRSRTSLLRTEQHKSCPAARNGPMTKIFNLSK